MQSIDDCGTTARARRGPLYALYAANAVSFVGDVLMLLAVPWFVLQTTGSITRTGITAFFETAAVAASAFFGGALVDRLGYRRASVLSDLTSGVCVALVPLLHHAGMLAFWELLALVFLAGLCTAPGATARTALVPDLAELARARLERVSAATDGIARISRFIGAPLAGVLIAFIGASNLLWIDAATFVFSAVVVRLALPARLSAAPHAPENTAHTSRGSRAMLAAYLADLSHGARFIWRDHVLLSITATVTLTNLLDAGFSGVLAPVYVRQAFGSALVLGGMIAAFGGAAFAGTVVFGAIGHRLPRRQTLGIAFTLGGPTHFLALALIPVVPKLLIVQVFAGFCVGPINPLIDTIAYERIPLALRARVFGTITAGAMLGTPLGAIVSSLCATWIGARATLLAFGGCYLLATASLLVNPALRALDQPNASREPVPVEV